MSKWKTIRDYLLESLEFLLINEDRPVRKIYSDYKIGKNSYKMVFPDIAVQRLQAMFQFPSFSPKSVWT